MAEAHRQSALIWFRQDLRVHDHPALRAACETGLPVIAVYILDDVTPGAWALGGASRWWLHHSLASLRYDLEALGIPLLLRQGESAGVINDVIATHHASHVFWSRCYEAYAIERDQKIKADLSERGLVVKSFSASLLHEPWTVQNKAGAPFKVFSPFYRKLLEIGGDLAPFPTPEPIRTPATYVNCDDVAELKLLPTSPDWAGGLRDTWQPGSDGAGKALQHFLEHGGAIYKKTRDRPDLDTTSRLSPHLHFGEIGPRDVWTAGEAWRARDPQSSAGLGVFLKEVGWREFSYHLLYHQPKLPEVTLRPEFADFPWREDPELIKAWQTGQTGYPIIDAAMRQLRVTGWMHNRLRMVVGSFLVKNLLQHWRHGEDWFWDNLVDADLASNAASWQWIAGCGADAAPYFRIFNPVLQGEKFDPEGHFVRKWLPALANVPKAYIHKPWLMPALLANSAGLRLGKTYPAPVVDLGASRKAALDAYAVIKKAS